MGIHGLLPQLRSIMEPIHAQDLRGQTVAVDTYSWLHKGAISCSLHLCKGLPTTRHIDYCMHRVNLLRHHGAKPILVFDGGLLPMKNDQEMKRARVRKENLERALEHEAAGNSVAAFDCYQKAVDISPSIAFQLIRVLKQENVEYIVAPYEADAQMTFLSIYNHVDAVITEDSDLIPFGCSRIIFKMDKFGQGVEFQSSKIEMNKDLNFRGFTKQMILEMCILSGCDYLPSLPGMGLKRAHALIRKHRSYDKVIKHLRYSGVSIPPHYEESYRKAVWAFLHQTVYDPVTECMVHLSDAPQNIGEDLDFLGPWLPPDVVKGIAKGDLDPVTKMPFKVEEVSKELISEKKFPIKSSGSTRRKLLDLPVQKNILTNYFCLASIQARRKFKAPKVTPKHVLEAWSQSSGSHDSASPSLDDLPISPATNEPQGSLVEDKLPNGCNRLWEFSLNGSSRQESNHDFAEPLLKSHEENGTKLNSRSSANKETVKRKAVTRSPFFHSDSLLEDAIGDENGVSCSRDDESVGELIQHNFPEASIKKKKADNLRDVSILKSNAACHDQGTNFPSSCKKDDDVKAQSFGRDISHVNDYCGIAEKSMERFVSLMNSFRHSSSGSRASGLRAPLRDVRNTYSVKSNKPLADFSEFAFNPGKSAARMGFSRSKLD